MEKEKIKTALELLQKAKNEMDYNDEDGGCFEVSLVYENIKSVIEILNELNVKGNNKKDTPLMHLAQRK